MAQVKIDYSDLKDAAKRAKDAADYYEDYADDLQKKVYNKLDESKLPESDSAGNISAARSAISSRMSALRKKKTYYSDLSASITKMKENIEAHEGNVVKEVRKIATDAMELDKRNKWEAFCQWLYGTFCVDLTNLTPITRALGNLVKKGLDWVQEKGTKIVNWFKRGEGRYILDIVLGVAGVIASIAATVAAVILAVASGGAATPLVVAAVASVIATTLTVVDTVVSVVNDIKALKILKDTDDPGQARFYGNIDDVGELTKRRDFGGKIANKFAEGFGIAHDVTREVANIVATVAGTIGAAGLTPKKVKDPATGKMILKTEYDSKAIKPNLIKAAQEKFGLKKVDGKWKIDLKHLFSKKKANYGASDTADLLKKNLLIDKIGRGNYKLIDGIESYAKKPSKINKIIDNWSGALDEDASGYERIKSTLKIVGDSDFYISGPVGTFNDHVIELIDKSNDLKEGLAAAKENQPGNTAKLPDPPFIHKREDFGGFGSGGGSGGGGKGGRGSGSVNIPHAPSGADVARGGHGRGAADVVANNPFINGRPHTGHNPVVPGGFAEAIANDSIINGRPHTGHNPGVPGGFAEAIANDPIINGRPHTGHNPGVPGGFADAIANDPIINGRPHTGHNPVVPGGFADAIPNDPIINGRPHTGHNPVVPGGFAGRKNGTSGGEY